MARGISFRGLYWALCRTSDCSKARGAFNRQSPREELSMSTIPERERRRRKRASDEGGRREKKRMQSDDVRCCFAVLLSRVLASAPRIFSLTIRVQCVDRRVQQGDDGDAAVDLEGRSRRGGHAGKNEKKSTKKKEVEMATVPSSFSHSLSCSPSTLSPSLSRPSFPKTPPPKNPPLSPRSPRLFPNARAARAALSVCESRGCGARPSGRVGGAEGEAFSVSFGNPSSLSSLEEEKGEKEKGGKERR